MLLTSVKNCNDFFRYKPPLVVFLICLVLMMATTFFFTFYIKISTRIVNTDVERNWISLTKHLNNLELCVANNTEQIFVQSNSAHYFVDEIATLVTLNATDLHGATNVQAYYNLDTWRPICPNDDHYEKILSVNFDVPPFLDVIDNETTVCAIVRGPKHYLPANSNPSCGLNDTQAANTTILLSSFCTVGESDTVRVLFESDTFEEYLTQGDKNVIYVHLMWCNYTLLFFVIVLLFYAMLYQHDSASKHYRLT